MWLARRAEYKLKIRGRGRQAGRQADMQFQAYLGY